ncbi:MAG: HNH endonuclease [Chloroflexi bacterium]|nr:MAG: HNH endonuclease [Chloroflexota bacterium]
MPKARVTSAVPRNPAAARTTPLQVHVLLGPVEPHKVDVVLAYFNEYSDISVAERQRMVVRLRQGKSIAFENQRPEAVQHMKRWMADRGIAVVIDSPLRREPIPKSVRQYVWQRDQGRCVDCGSKEKLEYDHIIPVSKGGSNTERNIELRCERCNRSKGARV